MEKIRIVVLASGRGSDFQSIIDAVEAGKTNAVIAGLLTENPGANAIERAKKHGIPAFVVDKKKFQTREAFEEAMFQKVRELEPELVVLAGYMRIIRDKKFLNDFRERVINIHPSLLPSFAGAHGQEDAFNHGVKISGYTIHFVDDSLDGGPIIWQEAVDISDCKTGQEVVDKILAREHVGLPRVIDMFSKGKFIVDGRHVRYQKIKKS